ncbi:hypothetical protein [Acetonema longum]|uniref:Uncharacterized protein n=1 Tax=Acetonema longum DSM 6540 TaxID=1009370 RepID=F7NPG7_9FIRM|nr:hypothetical protein [Acetonema longum]EGO62129.1 hypothetical protein ALO_20062 [Acetonema longum DSM 6540]
MALLTGDEHFTFGGMPTNYLLNDFWAWQASDLLNIALRGALAEFIVAKALNLNITESRKEWEAFDLLYEGIGESGGRIEVKSSAFLQFWEQKAYSRIQFSIRPALTWSSANGFNGEAKRQSDLYVFCLFNAMDNVTANPLNLISGKAEPSNSIFPSGPRPADG